MSQKPEGLEEREVIEVQHETRKPYAKPEILHELELETRAGTPLAPPGMLDPLDPLGPGLPPN